ncbi:MAG: cyanoexosortase B system-associated protein [Microcystaceae cyanobacterium]
MMNNLKSKPEPVSPLSAMPLKRKFPWVRLAFLFGLALMMAAMALPGYFQGQWKWEQSPSVAAYDRLLELRTTGLDIPPWQSLFQREMRLDSSKWSVQSLTNDEGQDMILMLLPQGVEREKPYVMWSRPYVEWTGIDGLEKWKKDTVKTIKIKTDRQSLVKARFFKAWNQQTFAVIQWYAWPGGGRTHNSDWFWRDQLAQWKGHRLPWIAVNVKLPINPLSSLDDQQTLAESIINQIQTTLETQIFLEPNLKD